MERVDALKLLKATASDDRLIGARILARKGEVEDVEALKAALVIETSRWTKSALRKAILALTPGPSSELIQIGAEGEEDRMIDQIRAEAIEETTQKVIHEIQPILGRLIVHASQEIPQYDLSKTAIEANRMQHLLTAIDSMRQAASPPKYVEFDLSSLIDQIITSEVAKTNIKVQQAGPKPFIILGSSNLLNLILGNAIRNSIEASAQVQSEEPVVVNWGSTDCHHWVAVLDRGPGLPVGSHKIFEFGVTTKKNHLGMGLALAEQAARSLNGNLELAPRSPIGARFEFRWPHVSL